MTLNLSKLFYKSSGDSFHSALTPDEAAVDTLKTAKSTIIGHLKKRIPEWLETNISKEASVEPRFRTQGSWAYKTCNAPCQTPPQEIDWDLGIYLPISVWEESNIQPKTAASVFYKMVQELMQPLAEQNSWTLSEKPTCVRVHLPQDCNAHIDLPLYAAPNQEFQQITEARMIKAEDHSIASFAEQQWNSLMQIVMAKKDGEWVNSDPGKVVVWFNSARSRHTDQLIRLSKYLKAWRDHVWVKGGPSSILLMVCAAQSLDACDQDLVSRDDLALQFILNKLPGMLACSVIEPMINEGEDLNKLNAEQRQEASKKANEFRNSLNTALNLPIACSNTVAYEIRAHLGDRFPTNTDDITPDDQSGIRSIPADPQPSQSLVAVSAG